MEKPIDEPWNLAIGPVPTTDEYTLCGRHNVLLIFFGRNTNYDQLVDR